VASRSSRSQTASGKQLNKTIENQPFVLSQNHLDAFPKASKWFWEII
jgi:hypothetical protein